MESRLALDTHIVLWLFTGKHDNLCTKAKELLANSSLCVSPIVEMELQLLYEIERSKYTAEFIINMLKDELNLIVLDTSFAETVAHSHQMHWTRDPFDRLIAATSAATGIPLLTKDRNILTNFDLAIW